MSIENGCCTPHLFGSRIFLTHEFKKMLDDSGVSLDGLTPDKISGTLSSSSRREVEYITNLASNAQLFQSYGIELKPVDCEMPIAGSSNEIQFYQIKSIENHRRVKLNAYCPDKETIILWQDEYYEGQPNDMFGANLKTVLKAMTRVMSFDDVLGSVSFEKLILRG